MREVRWATDALEDYEFWRRSDPHVHERLDRILASVRATPERGLGKLKPLRGELAGWWARRITREHRLVYRFDRDTVYVLQCRYHYSKE